MNTLSLPNYRLLPREDYLRLYYLLSRTRILNKKLEWLKETKRAFLGPALLSEGQEHVTVGAVFALEKAGIADKSWVGISHRDQGVFVWKNLEFEILKNHLMKATSWNKGRDGNMHTGSREHRIIPFGVSHMGSSVPEAVGVAEYLRECEWPDSEYPKKRPVVVVFFGDGAAQQGCIHESFNWAAASNAEADEEILENQEKFLDAISKETKRLRGAPVVFVINDNGYSLSVGRESEYGRSSLSRRADGYANMLGIDVFEQDPTQVYWATTEGIRRAQRLEGSTLIVAHCYRLCGHNSSEDKSYMRHNELAVARAKDPILFFGSFLENLKIRTNQKSKEEKPIFDKNELLEIWNKSEKEIGDLAEKALAEPDPDPRNARKNRSLFLAHTYSVSQISESAEEKKMKYREAINHALRLALKDNPQMVYFGEDVEDPKGGVLALTKGLSTEFGKRRVFNTPISEEALLGNAHGRALAGQRVIYEVQFAPFITPAMTQAAYAIPTSFHHNGINLSLTQITPYGVVGPGGSGNEHSHSNEAWFYHLQGWKMVFPSDAYDAAGLIASAIEDQNPVMVYLHIRANNDHEFARKVPLERFIIPIGKANVKRKGTDLTVVTYGAAAVESALNTAVLLEREKNISVEVLDLRSIVPLDSEAVLESVNKTKRVVIFQEASVTGSVGESIAAKIAGSGIVSKLRQPSIEVIGADDRPVDSAYALEWERLPFKEVSANFIYPDEDQDLKRLFSPALYERALLLLSSG